MKLLFWIITLGIALVMFTLFSGYVSGLTDLSFIKECSEGKIFKSSTTWTSYVRSQNAIFGKKVFKEELPSECQ